MSLDNTNAVDAIGTEIETGNVVLTIADSWDWDNEEQHLQALEDKTDAYLAFIESGEIVEAYPAAQGKTVVIDVVTRYPIPPKGMDFLKRASAAASELGVIIRNRTFLGSVDS